MICTCLKVRRFCFAFVSCVYVNGFLEKERALDASMKLAVELAVSAAGFHFTADDVRV